MCPDTDSFVTANSGMVLESYKFSVLAASSGEKPSEPASGPAASLTQTKEAAVCPGCVSSCPPACRCPQHCFPAGADGARVGSAQAGTGA
eukprot:jgi/Tetstr1/462613/TSEL_007598.t1